MITFAFAAGCGGSTTSAPSSPAGSATAAASTTIDCGTKIPGIEPFLEPGAVTLFGEMHGTVEAPAFIGNAACRAAQNGHEVLVGLEIPNTEQARVDAFLASTGDEVAVTALLEGTFWTFQDGRSSKAMLALLDQLRQLKQGGAQIGVVLFDGTMAPDQRDPTMASNLIAAIERSPKAVTLGLTGNIHSRVSAESYMGWHVRQKYPHLRTMNIAYSGGTAWVCMQDGCGERALRGKDHGTSPFVEITSEPDPFGHVGIYYVVQLTASPPARPREVAAKP